LKIAWSTLCPSDLWASWYTGCKWRATFRRSSITARSKCSRFSSPGSTMANRPAWGRVEARRGTENVRHDGGRLGAEDRLRSSAAGAAGSGQDAASEVRDGGVVVFRHEQR